MTTPYLDPADADRVRAKIAGNQPTEQIPAATPERPWRCPTCDSPQPSMHPAVGDGGEVTALCADTWHGGRP